MIGSSDTAYLRRAADAVGGNKLRVLFYIEPVAFRGDPLFVRPWLNWITQIMRVNPDLTFGFASSFPLCEVMQTAHMPCRFFRIGQRELLAQFRFDRHEYARDLYGKLGTTNDPLAEFLDAIDEQFQPEAVISFTQNKYIEDRFQGRVLFWEMSPIPRLNSNYSLFMDPLSHQCGGLPNLFKERILSLPLRDDQIDEAESIWAEKIELSLGANPLTHGVKDFLSSISNGGQVALLALQPPDWPTYEAAWKQIPVDQFIMRCSSELPRGWVLVPTFHPDQSLPESLSGAIEADFSNVKFPPRDLSSNKGELFLPHVDAVISISSSLSTQGIFHGKKTISLAQAQFSAFTHNGIGRLNDIKPWPSEARAPLLAFLSHRYSHAINDCTAVNGYVKDTIKMLIGDVESYFDVSSWNPEKLRRLL